MTNDIPATFGLAFATPRDWFAIRLPREQADADKLADQITSALPAAARSPATVRSALRDLAIASTKFHALCAYTTFLDVPGGVLPAALVANVMAMGSATLEEIGAQLSKPDGTLAPPVSRLVDLPAGRAVRVERLTEGGGSADGRHPVSLVIQYAAEVPDSGQAVVLTFSTPALGLAEQLRPLFHAIAQTLRFEGAEPER